MKSRIVRPLESPDQPYMSEKRKARAEATELSLSQYKTSLTPPSWPSDLASDAAADRKLARAETTLNEVAQREQVLATQVKAHRLCVAQLAEERALLEAERHEHAKKAKLAEDTLARIREELALESEKLARERKSLDAAQQEAARLAAEAEHRSAEPAAERASPAASDTPHLLPQLAKQAADFAALTDTVAKVQAQLAQARSEHEATVQNRLQELREREEALAQREAESEKRISAATQHLDTELQGMERAQVNFAAAKREHADWQLKLEATEADVAKREKELAAGIAKLSEDQSRLAAKRNAIADVEEGHHEREQELVRLEQALQQRTADLAQRHVALAVSEEQARNAIQQATATKAAVDALRAELDAGAEKLRRDAEAAAARQQELTTLSVALEARNAELAKREAAVENVTKEVIEVRQQALGLRDERATLEVKVAELASREKALEEKRVAFDECRRKFRETFSSFMTTD